MQKQSFKERKDKILSKIFISSEQRLEKLTKEVEFLRKENKLLRLCKKHSKDKILNIIGKIMREFEIEFEKKQKPLEQTKKAFYQFWLKLDRELFEELFPEVATADFVRSQRKVKLRAIKLKQEIVSDGQEVAKK